MFEYGGGGNSSKSRGPSTVHITYTVYKITLVCKFMRAMYAAAAAARKFTICARDINIR